MLITCVAVALATGITATPPTADCLSQALLTPHVNTMTERSQQSTVDQWL
jgi:hypothetical protein